MSAIVTGMSSLRFLFTRTPSSGGPPPRRARRGQRPIILDSGVAANRSEGRPRRRADPNTLGTLRCASMCCARPRLLCGIPASKASPSQDAGSQRIILREAPARRAVQRALAGPAVSLDGWTRLATAQPRLLCAPPPSTWNQNPCAEGHQQARSRLPSNLYIPTPAVADLTDRAVPIRAASPSPPHTLFTTNCVCLLCSVSH
ncbi:hypothetical protein C8Q79DRAFT_6097 [Trametes meyenii]|nr:hypothetical protein C8Q79DRAFT_6097 [Trametes meyenii]